MTIDTSKSAPIFDQPVILERRPIWSSIFVWGLIGMIASGFAWAAWAKIDQSIPASGKLEPKGGTVEVKSPTLGVVNDILVKGGDFVKEGQLLMTFNPTAPEADVESLRQLREALMRENQLYTAALGGATVGEAGSELYSMTQERSSLSSEIQYMQALANGGSASGGGGEFNINQERLLGASRDEKDSRVAAAQAQVEELEAQLAQALQQQGSNQRQLEKDNQELGIAQRQLDQARAQRDNVSSRIPSIQDRLDNARAQLPIAEQQLATAQETLALNEKILAQIEPVVREGALSQLQYTRQEQEVLKTQADVKTREADILNRRDQIAALQAELSRSNEEITERQRDVLRSEGDVTAREKAIADRNAEIARLETEAQRLNASIARAKAQRANTESLSEKDVRTRIAENQKRVAAIDDQFNQRMLENKKRIAQIDGELAKAQLQLQYQELRSPVSGEVFDVQPKAAGFVVNQTEPLLKIVRDAELEASIVIHNKDVALVLEALRKSQERGEEGVLVDIDIEAFPSMEYGTVKGTLTSIGSDVLPPEQERPFYAFPATVKLNSQKFLLDNQLQVRLQSGMAVRANIKIGNRTVLQMFMNRLTNQTKSLENVR